MLNIKSLAIATDGSYKRLAVTYDEIDDAGKIINGNVKVNRVVVDENVLHAVSTIEDFAKSIISNN
jgi:hypothetical protein